MLVNKLLIHKKNNLKNITNKNKQGLLTVTE